MSMQEAARALEDSGFFESSGGLDVVIANAGVAGGGLKSSTQLLASFVLIFLSSP